MVKCRKLEADQKIPQVNEAGAFLKGGAVVGSYEEADKLDSFELVLPGEVSPKEAHFLSSLFLPASLRKEWRIAPRRAGEKFVDTTLSERLCEADTFWTWEDCYDLAFGGEECELNQNSFDIFGTLKRDQAKVLGLFARANVQTMSEQTRKNLTEILSQFVRVSPPEAPYIAFLRESLAQPTRLCANSEDEVLLLSVPRKWTAENFGDILQALNSKISGRPEEREDKVTAALTAYRYYRDAVAEKEKLWAIVTDVQGDPASYAGAEKDGQWNTAVGSGDGSSTWDKAVASYNAALAKAKAILDPFKEAQVACTDASHPYGIRDALLARVKEHIGSIYLPQRPDRPGAPRKRPSKGKRPPKALPPAADEGRREKLPPAEKKGKIKVDPRGLDEADPPSGKPAADEPKPKSPPADVPPAAKKGKIKVDPRGLDEAD